MENQNTRVDANTKTAPDSYSLEEILAVQETTNDNQDTPQLYILNDEKNTFDWIIVCLVTHCKHTAIQAEQCALIAHTKGSCVVKKGELSKLEPIQEKLTKCNIKTSIQ